MLVLPEMLHCIPTMTNYQINFVKKCQNRVVALPQVIMPIKHFIHHGMYARSLTMPPNTVMIGALIKIPTILIISGDCGTYIGGEIKRFTGYNVVACEANRKQVFVSKNTTDLTMLFPTTANDVKKAEEQFTDEWALLTTRNEGV